VNADWFELGVSVERSAGEPIVSPTDSVMTLCAKNLGGEIDWSVTPAGGSFVSLRYPVRLVPTPSVARYA
jgi:hypothetical protein